MTERLNDHRRKCAEKKKNKSNAAPSRHYRLCRRHRQRCRRHRHRCCRCLPSHRAIVIDVVTVACCYVGRRRCRRHHHHHHSR